LSAVFVSNVRYVTQGLLYGYQALSHLSRHKVWDYFETKVGFTMALFNNLGAVARLSA